uniref:Exopolyphosphatase n=1 Tax=Noccaea caerulescens TaxID=107243 RepID=A0A1J3IRF8_NOCCA
MNSNMQSSPISSQLFTSIDMGTNSFKLLIVHADPPGRSFVPVERLKEPVVLSRESATSISSQSQIRALQSLQKFKSLILSHNVSCDRIRCVATEALRQAENQKEFVETVYEDLGLRVDVLSGEEEARLVYLGVLQFLPVFEKSVLCIDIGGGSTEFVVGKRGDVKLAVSLKLGHVNLTQMFMKNGIGLTEMRDFIRHAIDESRLADKLKESDGFEVVVGSSGTIRAIENALFSGYGTDLYQFNLEGYKRDWRFGRRELSSVVEKLCSEGDEEQIRREGFFKRRSEFIVAGAVLLEEIFKALGIEEMEVSEYALAEGVIADSLAKAFHGSYDLNANARWRSVMRLATRLNGKKRMNHAVHCANIAKAIFVGLRKCNDFSVILDEKDLEYLEAACFLHNIGIITGKKGYHKQSYHIIKNGDHLHSYTAEEVELIAMLTRYQRKKFPKLDRPPVKNFTVETRRKFIIMCLIIRLSVILQRSENLDLQEVEFLEPSESFKLVLKQQNQEPLVNGSHDHVKKKSDALQLEQEIEHLKRLFKKEMVVVLPS